MLGIVLVVYKSLEDTVHFVTQELPKITCPHKAVVVDLASPLDTTREMAARCGVEVTAAGAQVNRDDGLFFLNSQANLGYAKGNNLGAQFLLRQFPQTQWLLFSNTDVELVSPRLAEALIGVLQHHADVACVGPRVLSPDGTEQLPLSRPIPAAKVMWHSVAFPFLKDRPPWETAYKLRPGTAAGQCCYWVSGCFFMARVTDFVAAGMFDEETFLYCEEAILSERLQSLGKRFYYEPALEVRHHCGKTISRYLQNPALARIDVASTVHYYRTYRKIGVVQTLLLRLCGAVRILWVQLAHTRNAWRQVRAVPH